MLVPGIPYILRCSLRRLISRAKSYVVMPRPFVDKNISMAYSIFI